MHLSVKTKLVENSFETESEKKKFTPGGGRQKTLIIGRAECDCICVISSDFS